MVDLGDAIDHSENTPMGYEMVRSAYEYLISKYKNVYFEFGNHEQSSAKNNPIYSFMAEIAHQGIVQNYPRCIPLSFVDKIQTPEILEFTDFRMVFRAHGTFTNAPDRNKINILFLHDDYLSVRGIEQTFEEGHGISNTHIPPDLYDYIFVGHNHTVLEKWMDGRTEVWNLASLGRSSTKDAELNDNFRVRWIPYILMDENQRFKGIVKDDLVLQARAEIVNEVEIKKNKQSRRDYQFKKRTREILDNPNFSVTPPMDNLKAMVEATDNPAYLHAFNKLIKGEYI